MKRLRREWADWLTGAGIVAGVGLSGYGTATNNAALIGAAANLFVAVPLLRAQLSRNRHRKDDEK